MKILAIETSCDDTAIAIVDFKGSIENMKATVLSNVISSQTKTHAKFGGIVPNLASREHVKNIMPVFEMALKKAKISKKNLTKDIDLITTTSGPGLAPSLLIGVNFAKSLSYFSNIPLLKANHLLGHILSVLVNPNIKDYHRDINFPATCLLVSGGHTQLYKVNSFSDIKMVGETLDDAAGECFDKIAKLMNLGYPGGIYISKLASEFKEKHVEFKSEFNLPRPLCNSKDYNFSFSGLKTAVLYLIEKLKKQKKYNKKLIPQLCFEAQEAIVDSLVNKTMKLAKDSNSKTIMISGGVSANSRLREKFVLSIQKENLNIEFIAPDPIMSTDNACMIAIAAYLNHLNKKKDDPLTLEIDSNWAI